MNDRLRLDIMAGILGLAASAAHAYGPARPRLFHPSVPGKTVAHRRKLKKIAKASRKRNRAA